MLWNQIKAYRKPITGLLLTTFVTACVKNGSKDADPGVVQMKSLEATELSQEELEGSKSIELKDESDIAAVNIIKEYSFSETTIREFQIRQGQIKNTSCSDIGPFVYSYKLINSDGVAKDIHSKRNPELLVPGHYKVRVEIENGSLCKNISMELNIISKQRTDLVITPNEDRGYQCYFVKENGLIQNHSHVQVNTQPMQVIKFDENFGVSALADSKNLCYNPIQRKTICKDQPTPALKTENPVASIQRNCINEGQRYQRAEGHLQVNNRGQNTEIDFSCRHRGKVATLNLEDCNVTFNLGRDLPIRKGQTDLIVRNNRMHLSFDPVFSEINESQLPMEIYVGLARRVNNSHYEPVLNSFHVISRDDLIDGRIRIREDSMKNKIQAGSIEDLRIVFSRRPNLKQGLFNLSFKELCAHEGNSVLLKTNSVEKSLCE